MPEHLGRELSGESARDDGGSIIDAYLAEITARLAGPRRRRRELLAELRDGLMDAADHYRAEGSLSTVAAARAVRDCGRVAVVAHAYADLLADHQARRTALALLVTGPPIGVLWLAVLVPGRSPDALLLRNPALGVLVGTAAVAAALTVVATGRMARLLPRSERLPQITAGTACVAAMICDAGILTMASVQSLRDAAHHPPWLLALAAVAATCLRLTGSQHAARRQLSRLVDTSGRGWGARDQSGPGPPLRV